MAEATLLFRVLTAGLLLLISSDGAGDRVKLALDAIGSTFDVVLGLGGFDLSLAGGVLLLSTVGP